MSSTLNSIQVTRAQVQIPAWGVWWADVELAEPETLSGEATLRLPDVTLVGTIKSGGPLHGRARYRIAGGKGSWGKSLPSKGYANDAGVKVSTVINDAAKECGETVSGAPVDRLGPHYVRQAGPASSTLNLVAPLNWYVDEAGVTQIGQRAQTAYDGDATLLLHDRAHGMLELATESLAGLMPGVTLDGLTATDVEYDLGEKRLSVRLYGRSTTSRRLSAMAKLVLQLFPDLKYRGVYEFRVVSQDGERLNLQPVRASLGFSDLARVPVGSGLSGGRNDVALGSLVLVTFVNANPARPRVIAFDSPDSPGWIPLTTELQASASLLVEAPQIQVGENAVLGIARMSDPVQAGPFSGVITAASTKAMAG